MSALYGESLTTKTVRTLKKLALPNNVDEVFNSTKLEHQKGELKFKDYYYNDIFIIIIYEGWSRRGISESEKGDIRRELHSLSQGAGCSYKTYWDHYKNSMQILLKLNFKL